MALDVDRYPLPEGAQPELKPLDHPLPVVAMGFGGPRCLDSRFHR